MPSESTISVHREIQQAAKVVLHELAAQISATDTECSIAEKAYAGLCRPALAETWYYRCPAFVLLELVVVRPFPAVTTNLSGWTMKFSVVRETRRQQERLWRGPLRSAIAAASCRDGRAASRGWLTCCTVAALIATPTWASCLYP